MNSRFLLTAAHCLQRDNADPANVYALVGAYRQTNGGVHVELEKITPHEGFAMQKLVNDIGLIRTAEEIIFTELIQPIALPTLQLESTERVVLTGWGKHKVSLNGKSEFFSQSESEANLVLTCQK